MNRIGIFAPPRRGRGPQSGRGPMKFTAFPTIFNNDSYEFSMTVVRKSVIDSPAARTI